MNPGIILALGLVPLLSSAMSLTDALQRTYDTNPQLQSTRAQLRSARESLRSVQNQIVPQLLLTGTTGRTTTPRNTEATVDRDTEPDSYALRLQVPLYRGGYHAASINGEFYRSVAAEFVLRGTEQQVLLQAITVWFNLYRDGAILELSRQNEMLLAEQLRVMERRKQLGFATGTDVARTLSRLSQARRRTVVAEEANAVSRFTFETVVGALPQTSLVLEPNHLPLPTSEAQAVAIAGVRNPRLVSTRLSVESSRYGIALARSAGHPSVTLGASSSQREGFNNVDSLHTASQLDLTLSIPVSGLRTTKADIRSAQARFDAGRYALENESRAVHAATRAAWAAYRSATAIEPIVETEVMAAELSVTGLEKLVETGQADVSDLLDARRELLDARITEVTTQVDSELVTYALLAQLGTLSPVLLGLEERADPVADDEFELRVYRLLTRGLMPWLGATPDSRRFEEITSSIED